MRRRTGQEEREPGRQRPCGGRRATLLALRADARAARDYATADRLRDELAAMGVQVRDTPEGQLTTVRR